MIAARLKTIALVLLLPVLPGAVTGWLHPRRPDWRAALHPVRQLDLRAVPENALWIDAREEAEYAAGHVPGAVHLSESDWETGLVVLLDAWHPDTPVVVYCGGAGCDASRVVAERLRGELGVENIAVLAGGWPAWVAAKGKESVR